MRTRVGIFALLLLGVSSLASAQENTLRGHVVEFKDGVLILLAEEADGRIYTVDLADLPDDARTWLVKYRQEVGLGQAIEVVAAAGTAPDVLTVSRIIVDDPDRGWGEGPNRRLLKMSGTVESADDQRVGIRATWGVVVPMEASPWWSLSPGQTVTLVYEEAPDGRRLLRWVDAPRTT